MSRFEKKNLEPDSSWVETYGDMVTLLLCFFILLASISKVDTVLFEKVQSGMTKEIGKLPPQQPLENIRQELVEVINKAQGGEESADVSTDERGVVMNLDSGAMFSAGSADLKPAMMPMLKDLAGTIGNPRFETYRIEVRGHTDNTPVKTQQFPSNYDLAAARALTIMRALVGLGINPDRMIVSSYGATTPRVPNTLDGMPLPANQALNRRVAVHIYPR